MFFLNRYVHVSGDWLTSRPKGCSQPRELWFFDILMYIYTHYARVHIGFVAGGKTFGTAKSTHVKQVVYKALPSRGSGGMPPQKI